MTHDTPLRIVWFKRDLRVSDHAPLLHASRGKVIPLYILETGYWTLKDTSARQQDVLIAALRDLNAALSKLGAPLIVRQGDAVDVFKTLLAAHPVTEVVSHEETGNAWTYQRDLQVAKLFRSQNIPWREFPNHGVVRGLKDRDGWSKRWHQTMASAQVHPPEQLEPGADLTSDIDQLRASGASNEWLITARADAEQGLESFLQARGASYHLSMSSPLTAESACSRLSVPLSLGLISMREIYQATQAQTKRVTANKKDFPDTRPKALQAFGSRLRWHCHFMQKLEDEPAIELKTMHPAYEAVRGEPDQDRFQAWQEGMTGYPMVDACMRYLKTTGWLNFRMRAMLVSFASYHLWLDWRSTAPWLGRLFADYEPGIHYSQVQMQSGTTGMNAVRIYNPVKQGFDHDPTGEFIRQWVPELSDADNVHEPWTLGSQPKGYPKPIVDEATARKAAASAIYGLRRSAEHRKVAGDIVLKHGSRSKRRFGSRPTKKGSLAQTTSPQAELALD